MMSLQNIYHITSLLLDIGENRFMGLLLFHILQVDQADSTESSDSVDMVATTAAPCREDQYSLGDGCSDCAENCTACTGGHIGEATMGISWME